MIPLKSNNQNKKDHDVEVSIQKKRERELKYITSVRLFNSSHKLFQKDLDGNVTEADYMYDTGQTITWEEIINKDYTKLKRQLLYREGYKYCSALNKKNAIKRFRKMDKKGVDFLGKEFEPIMEWI